MYNNLTGLQIGKFLCIKKSGFGYRVKCSLIFSNEGGFANKISAKDPPY